MLYCLSHYKVEVRHGDSKVTHPGMKDDWVCYGCFFGRVFNRTEKSFRERIVVNCIAQRQLTVLL
jgi:hypothetical protein